MDPFLGSLWLVAFNFVPPGWAPCQGQLLPISQNTALFSLLGTNYGGDGVSTFGLPNMTGAKAMTDANGNALQWIIAIQGVYPSRN
jgi:microcystin-dependent protein